ncbi:hypothetical protein BC831DRAFT_476329 [Entophlyctis helioformis]|nr:hypothetical protein BC831DRAFT_476329 [Entophlyctis helioformis]
MRDRPHQHDRRMCTVGSPPSNPQQQQHECPQIPSSQHRTLHAQQNMQSSPASDDNQGRREQHLMAARGRRQAQETRAHRHSHQKADPQDQPAAEHAEPSHPKPLQPPPPDWLCML